MNSLSLSDAPPSPGVLCYALRLRKLASSASSIRNSSNVPALHPIGHPVGIEQNVFEWRRFSHWDSSAAKARLAAFALWELRNREQVTDVAARCGHRGADAELALIEAFRRESAISLELIVKAVIASNLQAKGADPAREGVPATHDLPQLWAIAGLPTLADEDMYRLHLVKQILMWSGRYATPRTPKAWEEENRTLTLLEPPVGEKERLRISSPIILTWSDFDRLYQIAQSDLESKSNATSDERD